METIVTPQAGNGMVVSDNNRHHHGDHHSVERLGLSNLHSQERFSLQVLHELANLRREVSESKAELAFKVLEEGCKSRELAREQENRAAKDKIDALRLQLSVLNSVPAV